MKWNEAKDLFKSARSKERGKPLPGREGSTRLKLASRYGRKDGDLAVSFHGTHVVTIHTDGTYTLGSNNWRSPSTKERIELYAPVNLTSYLGQWYVTARGKWVWSIGRDPKRTPKRVYEFTDGMRFNSKGELVPTKGVKVRSWNAVEFEAYMREERNKRARERRAMRKQAAEREALRKVEPYGSAYDSGQNTPTEHQSYPYSWPTLIEGGKRE